MLSIGGQGHTDNSVQSHMVGDSL